MYNIDVKIVSLIEFMQAHAIMDNHVGCGNGTKEGRREVSFVTSLSLT